ncbi:MAG: alpha/beta hydrolase, partial [Mesorhizobium sp.]
ERQGIIPAEALAALAMPATVLWGTADPVLPFTQSDGVPAHFRRQAIDGAGHMLVSEAPGAVRQAIMANLTAA